MVIDARDNYNKWYIAIVTARILEDKVFKLRIHYYKFNERWDEWISESPENLLRILPLDSSGLTEPDKEKIFSVNVMHRRSNNGEDTNIQIIGMPYCLNLSCELTCSQIHREISNQMQRHVSKLFPDSEAYNREENVSHDTQPDLK